MTSESERPIPPDPAAAPPPWDALATMGRWVGRGVRAWQLARTRLLWGWRLHALGARSVLGRSPRNSSMPPRSSESCSS